jgi:hypothetical protein
VLHGYDKKRLSFSQNGGPTVAEKKEIALAYSHHNCTAAGGGTSPGQLLLQRRLDARNRGLLDTAPNDLPPLRTLPAPTSGNHPDIPSNQFD